jgi:hypothetical protein
MKCGGLPGSFGDTGEEAANGTALDTGRAEDRALTGEAARIQDEGGVGASDAHWRRLLSFV